MIERRWFCFEVKIAGQSSYIGKCRTTMTEIRQAFPGALMRGNLVTITSRP